MSRGWESEPVQQGHIYLDWDTAGVDLGYLPPHSVALSLGVWIVEEFNGSDPVTLDVGYLDSGGDGSFGNVADLRATNPALDNTTPFPATVADFLAHGTGHGGSGSGNVITFALVPAADTNAGQALVVLTYAVVEPAE